MIVTRNPTTAWRVIEGEAVILALDTKVFRGLNPVGSRVWELIDGQRSTEDIAQVIVGEFQVAPDVAVRDLRAFIDELLSKGLVTRVP
jgi:hypothetical protein